MIIFDDEYYMREALKEAEKAKAKMAMAKTVCAATNPSAAEVPSAIQAR